jgi:hypothetical protein
MKFRMIRQDKMQPAPFADHHSRECLCRARHDIKVAPDWARRRWLRRMVHFDSELSEITG